MKKRPPTSPTPPAKRKAATLKKPVARTRKPRTPPPIRPPRAEPARRVTVRAPGVPAYEVRIGRGLIPSAAEGLLQPGAGALVLIDGHLPREIVEPLLRSLDRAGVRWGVSVITATEADKSLLSVERALCEAARVRVERGGLVIGLGGGIVCDIAGFVASTFKRGVHVVQCPTSLLAMVDAAVGGKTGVNLTVPDASGKPRLLKNMVGTFHHPARVVVDPLALRTLPARELRCGMAECLKHGLLGGAHGDGRLLEWTREHLSELLTLDAKAIGPLLQRNIALKARVVAKDPRETSPAKDGGRMALNLGHTFAHVLEPLPGLSWRGGDGSMQVGPLKHGEAVGLGLIAATHVSIAQRRMPVSAVEHLVETLRTIGLPTQVSGLAPSAELVERMGDDKKAAGGRVRLILPTKGLKVAVDDTVPGSLVSAAFDALRSAV